MIHLKTEAKPGQKPKKRNQKKTSSAVPQRPEGYFKDALTPEDIAEINMFSAAIAKMNWKAEKKNWTKTVADWKKFLGDKPKP